MAPDYDILTRCYNGARVSDLGCPDRVLVQELAGMIKVHPEVDLSSGKIRIREIATTTEQGRRIPDVYKNPGVYIINPF